jgi:molecular chaperone GrpE (heat shock protein)
MISSQRAVVLPEPAECGAPLSGGEDEAMEIESGGVSGQAPLPEPAEAAAGTDEARALAAQAATDAGEARALAAQAATDADEVRALAAQAAAGADEVRALAAQVVDLSARVGELVRISRDREVVINRLHEENQKLRAGELQQALAPVFRDLFRLYDDLESSAAALLASGPARDLEAFRDSVADILYRQGVDRFEAPAGARFDPHEQRGVAPVPTPDPARDRTVAEPLRAGFRTGSRVLRPADVKVFRYSPPPAADPAPEGPAEG